MVDRWKRLSTGAVEDHRIFRLRHDRYQHARLDAPRDFVVLDSVDWVNVVPVTDEGRVVLIRQYRHGIAEVTLEIPGGMVDSADGDPARAARREMVEETGYECREIVRLGAVHPNPAIQTNTCHSFLAVGAYRADEPRPDGAEVIEVEERDLAEIPGLIDSGAITHALVVAGFFWLDQWMRREKGATLGDGWR